MSAKASSKSPSSNKTAVIHAKFEQQSWEGPMPPPAVIKQYDEIIENGAERLFKQFESESVHRREMEKIVTKYKGRDLLIGKVLALVFALAVFTVVAVAILNNSPWVAAVLGGGMLGTVIFGFLRIFGDGPRSKPSKQEISKRVN